MDFRPGGLQQLPAIVKNLLIINVLVFILRYVLSTRGIDLDQYLGLHYWQSPLFHWWQPVTHLFMHGSITHILFNMFSLWMFGRILESFWGAERFVFFYFVCGLGAALCHMGVLTFEYSRYYNAFLAYQQHPGIDAFVTFVNHYHVGINPEFVRNWSIQPSSPDMTRASVEILNKFYFGDSTFQGMINEPTVGASGAVCGLLFAFGYLFPNTELYIYFIPIPIKAKWVVAALIVMELSEGVYNAAGDNVAHFAHLGGMLFAFILLRIWRKRIRNRFY
jgi:membrane associated rhomboid family serine protease